MQDEIVSIEEVGDRETVDISVSDNNLFYANNILTHNSAYDEVNPGIDSTSESMGLSMTVDAQISLWANDEDREMGVIHAAIQKSRFGPRTGAKGVFNVDWNTLRLTESGDTIIEGKELANVHNILTSLEG